MADRGKLGLISLLVGSLSCASLDVKKPPENAVFRPSQSSTTSIDLTPPIPPIYRAQIINFSSNEISYEKNDQKVTQGIIDEIFNVVQPIRVRYKVRAADYDRQEYLGIGSAIILASSDGVRYAVTNNHNTPHNRDLCDDWRTIYELTVGGKSGKVVQRSCYDDVAIIKLDDHSLPFFNGCLGKGVRPGDYVLGAGYGFGGPQALVEGKVRAVIEDEKWIHYNGQMVHGDSGEPLFAIRNGRPFWIALSTVMITDGGDNVGISGAKAAGILADLLKNYPEDGRKPLEHYVTGECAR